MEHWKRLTSQQLVLAACCALLLASVTLSKGNYLGYGAMALAVLCGIGAFIKAQDR